MDFEELEKKLDILTEKIDNNLDLINKNKEQISHNTGALDLLHTIKSNGDKFFVIWLLTFIVFILSMVSAITYIVYLKTNINTIETTTTQELSQEASEGSNYYIGRDGDINGETKN